MKPDNFFFQKGIFELRKKYIFEVACTTRIESTHSMHKIMWLANHTRIYFQLETFIKLKRKAIKTLLLIQSI